MSLRGHPLRASDIVSLILNPSAWTAVLACFLAAAYEPAGWRRTIRAAVAVLFTGILPIVQLFILKSAGRLSDVEMHVRTERTAVYRLNAAEYFLGAGILLAVGAGWPLVGLLAVHVPNTLIMAACNKRLKISLHAMVLSSVYVAALIFFGPGLAPAGLAVAVAAWARWDAGNHTPAELAAGALLGAGLSSVEFGLLQSLFGGGHP